MDFSFSPPKTSSTPSTPSPMRRRTDAHKQHTTGFLHQQEPTAAPSDTPTPPTTDHTSRGKKKLGVARFHLRLTVLPLLTLKGHVIPSTMQNERRWSISPLSSLQLCFRTQSCLFFSPPSSFINQTCPLPLSTLLATNHKR